MKQVVVIFWAFIFGEIIGYIGGKLDALPYTPLEIGIIAAVVALLTANMITLISKPKK
jgi:hypothetical protein